MAFDEARNLVPIDAVTVHDSEEPQIIDAIEVLLNDETVLVDLAHLRDESCSRLVGNGFN